MKSYSELIKLNSYQERLNYLRLYSGSPSNQNRRFMNKFYKSRAWSEVRNFVISRDIACDLAVLGFFIEGPIIIHHINPISEKDVEEMNDKLLDPENLICVSIETHNKIHYLDKPIEEYVERKPGDTKLW